MEKYNNDDNIIDNDEYKVDKVYENEIKKKLLSFKSNSYIEKIQNEFYIMFDYIKMLEEDVSKLKRENTKLKKENKFLKKYVKELEHFNETMKDGGNIDKK